MLKNKKKWVREDIIREEGEDRKAGEMRGREERSGRRRITDGGPVASRREASCSCHLLCYFYTSWLSR